MKIIISLLATLAIVAFLSGKILAEDIGEKLRPKWEAFRNADSDAERQRLLEEMSEIDRAHQNAQAASIAVGSRDNGADIRQKVKQLYWADGDSFRQVAAATAELGYSMKEPFCANLLAVRLYENGQKEKALEIWFEMARINCYPPIAHNLAVAMYDMGEKKLAGNMGAFYSEMRRLSHINYRLEEFIKADPKGKDSLLSEKEITDGAILTRLGIDSYSK